MSTEMARLAPNKKSKRRQQETSVRATRSNGLVVTPPAISHSSVPRRTNCLSPSSSHSPRSTITSPSVSPLSETPRSSPHVENDRDAGRETPRSRVGSPPPPSNSGHGASRSGRAPLLLTNSTDETPRSSLGSDESRRDERRATRPPACNDGLSSGEILRQIQDFCQRQEAFNAKIEEHLQTAPLVDRERRTRRLPKAVTVRVYLQFY